MVAQPGLFPLRGRQCRLHFSHEEKDLLLALSAPIDRQRRGEFLAAVADALANCPQPGPGVTHRVAAQIQRRFWEPP